MTQKRKNSCCDIPGFPEPAFFKALCDPTRLAMLGRLAEAEGPRTVSEVAQDFPVDVSVVSRHLATLRVAGIVSAERRGKEVLYAVEARSLVEILTAFVEAIRCCCPEACEP